MRHPHTTDEHGFDYMDNSDIEEHDRDMVGIILALVLMAGTVICQSFGLL